jgi:biopolymer transport protein ExbD
VVLLWFAFLSFALFVTWTRGYRIVTVAGDGTLYFGLDPVTPEELTNEMTSHPRERRQSLYIKADARASFAEVQKAFDAAARTDFERPVLLTSQPEPQAGGIAVPKGLEVWVGAGSDAEVRVMRLFAAPQSGPGLEIDDQRVPWSGLREALHRIGQSQRRAILLQADGQLAYSQVVQAIDACRGAGFRVVVATPSM